MGPKSCIFPQKTQPPYLRTALQVLHGQGARPTPVLLRQVRVEFGHRVSPQLGPMTAVLRFNYTLFRAKESTHGSSAAGLRPGAQHGPEPRAAVQVAGGAVGDSAR